MNTKQVVAVAITGAIALGVGVSVTGSTGGLRRVSHGSGMLGGDGTSSSPLTVTVTKGTGFSGTGSAGDPLVLTKTYDGGWFGDGWDGDCTFDGTTVVGNPLSTTFTPGTCSTGTRTPRGCDIQGTGPQAGAAITKAYTITRDIYCDHLTVSSGVYVYHPTFRIFAKSGVVNNGWIGVMGQPPPIGSEATSVQGPLGGTVPGGGTSGGAGQVGVTGGNGIPQRLKDFGGVSGSGGQGGTGFGAAGAGLGTATAADSFSPLYNAIGNIGTQHNVIAARLTPGGGGGQGDGFSGCAGGAGGAGGGLLYIAAPTFTGSGYLSAPGGNGARGSDVCTGITRDGGGGGGGHGGFIHVVYSSGSMPNTDVSGGAHGDQSIHAAGLTPATDGAAGGVISYKIGPN